MNIINLIRKVLPNNRTAISSDKTEHSVPVAHYGENASRIALIKHCLTSLFCKPPKITALILALTLTIPTGIIIVSSGFISAEKNLLDSRQVTVFLTGNNSSEASQLSEILADSRHITSAELRPVDLLDKKVMAIDIQPAATLDRAQLQFIVDELTSHTSVDYVAADQLWLERNVEAIEATRKLRLISIALAALFTAAIVYLLVRFDLPRQKSDHSVLLQMGASRRTMLKPLLMRSILLTFTACVIGTLLASGIIAALPHLVDMSTYKEILPRSFPVTRIVSLIFLAIMSGYVTVRLLAKQE